MRDLNDEVLTNPFDDPLKQIVTAFREVAQTHGGNRRPTRTEETFPEKASDERRTILSTARTNRLPERGGFEMQGTLCPKSGQTLHISQL